MCFLIGMKINVCQGSISGKSQLLGLQMSIFRLCLHKAEKEKEREKGGEDKLSIVFSGKSNNSIIS